MNTLEESFAYFICIDRTDRWIDSKGNAGLSINLILDQLIARRSEMSLLGLSDILLMQLDGTVCSLLA